MDYYVTCALEVKLILFVMALRLFSLFSFALVSEHSFGRIVCRFSMVALHHSSPIQKSYDV